MNYSSHLPQSVVSVLVLGCTPVLRNYLKSKGYKVIAVDITREMINITRPLVADDGEELMIQGDWLYLPLPNNSVDAVVGDKVLGNVMPEGWPQLFAEIGRVLRMNGVFLTRATPHGKFFLQPPPHRSFVDLLTKWTVLYKAGMKLDNASSGLWEDLMDISTEKVTLSLGTQQLSRAIPDTQEECINAAGNDWYAYILVSDFIQKYWVSRYARWSAYALYSIQTVASHHFHFKDSYEASDYHEGDRQPIFHFVRHSQVDGQ